MILIFLFASPSFANNLSLSNITVKDCDPSTTPLFTAILQFDISWDNSWRDSINYDAVWVFIKISNPSALENANTVTWSHAYLAESGLNPSGFSSGSGTGVEIVVPEDRAGAFIRRSGPGSGSVSASNVEISFNASASNWNCETIFGQGLNAQIYGVEMVYIPQGGFHAGDGGTGSQAEFEYGSSSSLAAPINNAEGISFSNVSEGGWYYNSGSNTGEYASGSVFNVTSIFPNGYNAFYIMKYEITQGQYTDFLNRIPRNQQRSRVQSAVSSAVIVNNFVMSGTSAVSNRNRITCNTSGNTTNTRITFSATSSIGSGRENRACNFLNWMDVVAYADWATLRPLTELEFEKAARGPIYPVPSEYAWGSTSITAAATISGTEDGTEYITDSGANSNYGSTTFTGGDATSGPLRAGIFATSSTATRVTSGAGYYGAMDLSGNVYEFYVTLGNTVGLGFSGTHGDGLLANVTGAASDGGATNLDWPGIDATDTARGVTAATGAGYRGGGNASSSTSLETSDRVNAANPTTTRSNNSGGRVGRTAPPW